MINFTIISFGKLHSKKPAAILIDNYLKRISWRVNIIELEEKTKFSTPQEIRTQNTILLTKKIPKNTNKIIALDENGENITSQTFNNIISNWQNNSYSNIVILIGGAYGIKKQHLTNIDLTLSFGKLTWPHMMVRVMICEQIYRTYSIIHNHPYHK